MKRGNARRAKGPCRRHSEQEARQERDDKAHHQSAGTSSEDRPSGEIRPRASLLGFARPPRETRYARSGIPGGEAQRRRPREPTARRSRLSRSRGRGEFLTELAAELRGGHVQPRGRIDEERFQRRAARSASSRFPAIRDRVVQGALRLLLEPIFEADFSGSSYGARPGRSAHQAIEKVRTGLRQRRHRVVDVDLIALLRHHPARPVAGKGGAAGCRRRGARAGEAIPEKHGRTGRAARLAAVASSREPRAERPRPRVGSRGRLHHLCAVPGRHGRARARLREGPEVGRPRARTHPPRGGCNRRVAQRGEDANGQHHRTVARPSRFWVSSFAGCEARKPEPGIHARPRARRK